MRLPFGFSLEADFSGDGYLFLFILIIGTAFVFLMNKPRKLGLSRLESWLNWIFPLIRIFALFIILLLFFSPEVSLNRTYQIEKHIAVIVDESRSMNSAWEGTGGLKDIIKKVVDDLEANHRVDLWSLDGQKLEASEIQFDNDLSSFDWNPVEANSRDGGELFSSVFLFSDGHLNAGRSPLDMAWTKALDINIIYPQAPKATTSLKLVDVGYLSDGQENNEYFIRGKLFQEGLLGQRALVRVFGENEELLNEESLQLRQGYQNFSLPVNIQTESEFAVNVSVSLESGEYLNQRYLKIRPVRKLSEVLLVSERVNSLHKFLVQSFSDSSYHLTAISGTQATGASLGITLPDRVDLVVLNYPGEFAAQQVAEYLDPQFDLAGTPLITFYDGSGELPGDLDGIVGVRGYSSKNGSGSQTVFWSENALEHAFYLGLLGKGLDPNGFLEYAPIELPNMQALDGGRQILSSGYGGTERIVFSLSEQPPRAIFTGRGFWKWFFHPHSKPSFRAFWDHLIIYLREAASFKPVQLELPTESAATGSYLVGDVVIKDIENRSITSAEVRVWQENEQGDKNALNLLKSDAGVVQVQIDTKLPGEQQIIAEAYRFGELWGRDTSRIHLMSFNREDQSRGVDEVFLARLAARSGGEIIQVYEAEIPNIPMESLERATSLKFRGVNSPRLLVVLLLLLGAEWIWRRRRGLL